jgi:hypothetical protein
MDLSSLAQPLQQAAIGAKVKKQFHSDGSAKLEWFTGTVTSFNVPRKQ